MKKFIVLSIALGVMVSNSLILKELASDANMSSNEIQQEQLAKSPVYSPTKIIWFF